MRNAIINLEEKILINKYYLLEHCENIEAVLEQITMILDFGMSNEDIQKWFKLNRLSVKIIYELLERKLETSLC